jgi:hypothetical protein
MPVAGISRAAAAKELANAKSEKPGTAADIASQAKKLERARKLVSMATVD